MDSAASPSVTFQMSSDDITALRRHASGSGNSSFQRIVSVLSVLFLLVIAAGFAFSSRQRVSTTGFGAPPASGSSLSTLVPLFLPLVLFVFFYLLITRTKVGVNTRAPILQRPSEVTLLPDVFSHSFGAITTLVRWDGIENIISTPTHLFVLTMPQDGYPVPSRAFASDADFATFCEFARDKWQQARPEFPPIAQV